MALLLVSHPGFAIADHSAPSGSHGVANRGCLTIHAKENGPATCSSPGDSLGGDRCAPRLAFAQTALPACEAGRYAARISGGAATTSALRGTRRSWTSSARVCDAMISRGRGWAAESECRRCGCGRRSAGRKSSASSQRRLAVAPATGNAGPASVIAATTRVAIVLMVLKTSGPIIVNTASLRSSRTG